MIVINSLNDQFWDKLSIQSIPITFGGYVDTCISIYIDRYNHMGHTSSVVYIPPFNRKGESP